MKYQYLTLNYISLSLQLTLNLLTSVCNTSKQSMVSITEGVLPQLLLLIKSPLLQGNHKMTTSSLSYIIHLNS